PAGGTPLTEPTGAVYFYADGSCLGFGYVDEQGVAMLTVGSLAVGAHTITASYTGDGVFGGSDSAGMIQTVLANGTGISSPNSSLPTSYYGDDVTFTVQVTPVGGTPLTGPTGAVYFYADDS